MALLLRCRLPQVHEDLTQITLCHSYGNTFPRVSQLILRWKDKNSHHHNSEVIDTQKWYKQYLGGHLSLLLTELYWLDVSPKYWDLLSSEMLRCHSVYTVQLPDNQNEPVMGQGTGVIRQKLHWVLSSHSHTCCSLYIHSFIQQMWLGSNCVSGNVLGSKDRAVKKPDEFLPLMEFIVLVRGDKQ